MDLTFQEPSYLLKSRLMRNPVPVHPHLNLQILSRPGVLDLLLALVHDQRGRLLINPLPSHEGFQNVKR